MELAGDREPWERQDSEPQKAHELLCAYLDLGPTRTLTQLSQTHTATLSRLRGHYRDWQWGARARYWDRHQQWAATAAAGEAHNRAAADLTDTAHLMAHTAGRRLATTDPDELSPTDAAKLAGDAARVLAATKPERATPPPQRTALAEAIAAGTDPADAAQHTALELTGTTAENATSGDSAAARAATGLLEALAGTTAPGADTGQLLTLIDAALAPYPDARAAVLSAVTHPPAA